MRPLARAPNCLVNVSTNRSARVAPRTVLDVGDSSYWDTLTSILVEVMADRVACVAFSVEAAAEMHDEGSPTVDDPGTMHSKYFSMRTCARLSTVKKIFWMRCLGRDRLRPDLFRPDGFSQIALNRFMTCLGQSCLGQYLQTPRGPSRVRPFWLTGLAFKSCPPVPPTQLRLPRASRALQAASSSSRPSGDAPDSSAGLAQASEAPPDVASDSDSDWDALLDAHGLTPPPSVAAAAVAQPADAPLLCESSRASDLTLRASPAWASLARFPHSCGMAPHVCSRP